MKIINNFLMNYASGLELPTPNFALFQYASTLTWNIEQLKKTNIH